MNNNNLNKNDTVDDNDIKIYETFEDMDLNDKLLRGIYSLGFEKPSVIQQKGIKAIIDGGDLIAQSQSGTGKTATFSIGLLQCINPNQNIQGIIIAHTRELANQIYTVINNLGQYLKYNIGLLTGGFSINDNLEVLKKNPKIIVGTPGRLLDLLNKRRLNIYDIKYVIIDEADELLSYGFINQIYDIFKHLRSNHLNVILFSATMPKEFFEISNKILNKPKKILVKTEQLTLEGIKQFYINVERNDYKYDVLCDLYNVISVSQSIIYCNSKKMVDDLHYKLKNNNFTVVSIHSNMEQQERLNIIKKFREGEHRILLSTDLLSRGLDVQQVSIVINYDIPINIESYIHRIGRSGRFGRKGLSINLVTLYIMVILIY